MDNLQTAMITNYYTIFHVATELNREFTGKTVHEIFTQHHDELVLSFDGIKAVIIVGCNPSNNYIYLRKDFTRARRNSVDLFESIIGSHVERIFIHASDREIIINFKDEKRLIIQLFGSKANVFLIDNSDTITDSFLRKKTMLGTRIVEQHIIPNNFSVEELHRKFISFNEVTTNTQLRLKSIFPQFGNVLVRELLFRCGIDEKKPFSSLTENEIKYIIQISSQLISELTGTPSPRIYFDGPMPLKFSAIALQHLNDYHYELFNSVSEGIRVYIGSKQKEYSIQLEKNIMEKTLLKEIEQIHRTLQKIESEAITTAQADDYELKGKLLMANLHDLHKGMKEALVENVFHEQSEPMIIILDPRLTPAKNADRYFEKAKKTCHAIEEQRERKATLEQRCVLLQNTLDQMENVESSEDFKEYKDTHSEILTSIGINVNKSGHVAKKEPLPFRIFTVAGGYKVWAGKSSENNDLLTTRYTAKNDFWFHARSVGGSHVVLKVGTGKGEISKQAIEQAAAIAAYYSKMKKAKMVPVTMCEGKYVRKRKGTPAGTVTVERENTLFAEPKLPNSKMESTS